MLREERVDMCKAIQDIRLEGFEQGVDGTIITMITMLKEAGWSEESIIDNLVEFFHVSEEDAERYVYGD